MSIVLKLNVVVGIFQFKNPAGCAWRCQFSHLSYTDPLQPTPQPPPSRQVQHIFISLSILLAFASSHYSAVSQLVATLAAWLFRRCDEFYVARSKATVTDFFFGGLTAPRSWIINKYICGERVRTSIERCVCMAEA